MEKCDIPCDRSVVSRDVDILNELGIEILETWVGKKKGYYVAERSFSTPELKILIDAVQRQKKVIFRYFDIDINREKVTARTDTITR